MFADALLPMLSVFVDVSVAEIVQACVCDLLVYYCVLCIFSSEVLLPLFLKACVVYFIRQDAFISMLSLSEHSTFSFVYNLH